MLFEFLKYFHTNNEAVGWDGNTQVDVNQEFCPHLEFGAGFKSVNFIIMLHKCYIYSFVCIKYQRRYFNL